MKESRPLFRPTIFLRIFAPVMAAFLVASSAAAWTPNAQEIGVANKMKGAGQHRPFLAMDPILSKVARERAIDMAKRDYFGHVNPAGKAANWLVTQAGYQLPASYPKDESANNLESIAAGYPDVDAVWQGWMESTPHRTHLLAETAFFVPQTSYGIGYYYDPNSKYGSYWVVITAPPNAPALTINSPANGSRKPEGVVEATGTAGGEKPVSAVQCRIENASGIGTYSNATGTKNWSATLSGLMPGINTLRVRSLDANNVVLKEITSRFTYVVLRPLSVNVDGEGIVTPGFLGITEREIGRTYTLLEAPSRGFLFSGWNGSATATTKALTFTMQEGFSITAHFIPNPFPAVKGYYNGLIGDGTHEESGALKLAITAAGQFNGSLIWGGTKYLVHGRFTPAGAAEFNVNRGTSSPLHVALQLDLQNGTDQITGSVQSDAITAAITASRALPLHSDPSEFMGRYTVSLPLDESDPSLPQGDGYAVLNVNAAGLAKVAGALADGRPFATAGFVSKDGTLPIYLSLFGGKGSLSGMIHFRALPGTDADGTLHWTKPARAADRYYPAAFETTLAFGGSRYSVPEAGQQVVHVAAGENNAELALGMGNLDSEIVQLATLNESNRVIVNAPLLTGLQVRIAPQNGRFSGWFIHPVTGKTTRLNGVIFQKQNLGAGFFLGKDSSGYANFEAAN